MLDEAPEFHGVGDGLDALHEPECQGNEDGVGGFQALDQADLLVHPNASNPLSQGDFPVFSLDVPDVAQGQRNPSSALSKTGVSRQAEEPDFSGSPGVRRLDDY